MSIIQYAINRVMPLAKKTGLMISLATFQDENGVPVTGLIDIQCQDAPLGTGEGFSVDEMKAQPQLLSKGERHVLLAGYYPTAEDVWRNGGDVVIDGTQYDILGAESDSQRQQTRVRAGKATI